MDWTRVQPDRRVDAGIHTEEAGKKSGGRDVPALRFLSSLVRRYAARNERLRICETLPLGGRRGVALIECDGQRFLVGMSAGGVETLVPVPGTLAREDAR